MGRKTWIWTLLAVAVVALLIAAWLDGGATPLRSIEQPVTLPDDAA